MKQSDLSLDRVRPCFRTPDERMKLGADPVSAEVPPKSPKTPVGSPPTHHIGRRGPVGG
jgi:hypothetical protein